MCEPTTEFRLKVNLGVEEKLRRWREDSISGARFREEQNDPTL